MAAKQLMLLRVGVPTVSMVDVLVKGCSTPGPPGAGSPAPRSVPGIQGGTELTPE